MISSAHARSLSCFGQAYTWAIPPCGSQRQPFCLLSRPRGSTHRRFAFDAERLVRHGPPEYTPHLSRPLPGPPRLARAVECPGWFRLLELRPSAPRSIRLGAVGDLSLSGRALAAPGPEALQSVEPQLQSVDLLFANYEGVLLDIPEPSPFTAPTDRAKVLGVAARTIVNVANNHTNDHHHPGLASTVAALEAAGCDVIGLDVPGPESRLHTVQCHGLTIGFFAAARTGTTVPKEFPRVHELDWDALRRGVAKARGDVPAISKREPGPGSAEPTNQPNVDIIVVSIHAGYMYVDHPHPEHRKQVLALLEAGADLVLMHHPHVLQGIEVGARGGVACYSLGNFLVDPREGCLDIDVAHELQRQGGIFSFEVDRNGVSAVDVLPTVIKNGSRVEPADHATSAKIESRLRRISADLQGDYEATFYQQRSERNTGLGIAELRSLLLTGRWGRLLRTLSRGRPEHVAMLWKHCTRYLRR